MRIALYENLPSGGAKRVTYEHCKRLVARGHEVDVYEPETAAREFLDLAEVATKVVRLPLNWQEPDFRGGWRRLLRPVRNTRLMRANHLRLEAMQKELATQIDEEQYDLLYAHHDVFETAPSLLRHSRLPSLYYCQEPHRPFFETPLNELPPECFQGIDGRSLWQQSLLRGPFTSYIRDFRIRNERLNTLAADRVLCNSSYSGESILRAHGRPALLCRLGVDAELFAPSSNEREDYVLSVGGFIVQKGFRFILRALGQVPAHARPPLVVIGDRAEGGERDCLAHMADEHGVELETHEGVTDAELVELYRRARLFLYAPYLEPLGLVALEAMACGTPVLGVQEGGVRETVVPGISGDLVARDEGLFARRLTEMLAHPDELIGLGHSARACVVEHWTWEQSVDHLLEHAESVLEMARSAGD